MSRSQRGAMSTQTALALGFCMFIFFVALGYFMSQSPGNSGPTPGPGPADSSGTTTGTLTVISNGADIWVDGYDTGAASVNVEVAAGNHIVKAIRPSTGAVCWTSTIAVSAGGSNGVNNDAYCR